MSESTQAIFFFLAFLGCLIAGLVGLHGNRTVNGLHFGWLGLASFLFVFFWIAVKAS